MPTHMLLRFLYAFGTKNTQYDRGGTQYTFPEDLAIKLFPSRSIKTEGRTGRFGKRAATEAYSEKH
jgi:hypothetical protein